MRLLNFKKCLIVFWALWWLIALWTDVVGGLAHLNWLKASWAPDVNYLFLVESLKMYSLPEWVPGFLYLGIVLWSCVASLLFGWASLSLNNTTEVWMNRAKIAFMVSLCYWLVFFLADQLVMKFDLEQNHMVQGGFQLLTFLSLYVLPND